MRYLASRSFITRGAFSLAVPVALHGACAAGPAVDDRAGPEAGVPAATRPADSTTRPAESQGFRLTLRLDGDGDHIVPADEPVVVVVTLENVTDEPLRFSQRKRADDLLLDVVGEDGKTVPLTLYGKELERQRESRIGDLSLRQVGPRGRIEFRRRVDRQFDMTLSRVYTVRARRGVPRRGLGGHRWVLAPRVELTSNAIRVGVDDQTRRLKVQQPAERR
jgi:hypothetical protein